MPSVVHVTTHKSGKLAGFKSINTSSLLNGFCEKTSKLGGGIVCSYCYSRRMESYRKTLHAALVRNSALLSAPLADDQLPRFAEGEIVRFNSFGEIINDDHMRNIVRICNLSPKAVFALWTKRIGTVISVLDEVGKPSNLQLIESWPLLDGSRANRLPKYFDRIFYVQRIATDRINCSAKCASCMKCYTKGGPTAIYELLRK